eukprot:XP_011678982.1 PREDICTED: uncharacterized protein LOC100888337 isoform X2 [Strongylocentrotus purpuratus]
MEKNSEEMQGNGEGNETDGTKEEENMRAADSGDTENGVVQNVADGIKAEGPEEFEELDATEDNNIPIPQGKTDQTNASNLEVSEQAEPVSNPHTPTEKDGEDLFEYVIKEIPVSISVCTSAYDFNVQGIVYFLRDIMKDHPELIKEVKVHALPYNDLDHYKFPKENPVDVMLLCHSINNRGFRITDVMDALYDEYLPYCARVVGKNKMGVIVHDFDDMRETVQSSRMSSFRYKQPKAFETTSLQITCGHIKEKEQVLEQMQEVDREKLLEFLKNASKCPEEMVANPSLLKKAYSTLYLFCESVKAQVGGSQDSTSEGSSVHRSEAERNDHGQTKKATSGGSHQTLQASVDERELNPSREASPIGQQRPGTSNLAAAAHTHSLPSPRRISISVCSSAYEQNVEGFMSKLTKLLAAQPHMVADVRFRSLPYNDIDSFRFPSNDTVDVMVLCHSVQNRGFSITNVLNALYEKYLQYCHDVIGKKKLAVIVHDFSDCKPQTLDVRMESFRRSQPLTFELVDSVIVCGSLGKPGKIEIRDEDMTRLTTFFERARFEPKENNADDQSLIESLQGTSGGFHQTPQASMDERNQNTPRESSLIGQQRPGTSDVAAAANNRGSPGQRPMASRMTVTSAPQVSTPSPRRISVSVCSSAYEHNVKGFMSQLTKLLAAQPYVIADVRFRSLPYADIDSFRFPSNDPVDVMVLCHSVQNRGFSITNVLNALYEKYLQYCHDVIGKKKLALIVHDFSDCKPKILNARIESFRRLQPLTFELVDTVIGCGSLEVPGKIEMRDEDMTRLAIFFERARFEPKNNTADVRSLMKSLRGMFK